MVTNLLSSQNIYAKQEYIVQLFNILLNKIKSETKDNFLQTGKIVILLCTSLLSSKSANQGNYVEILNNYYLPIVNIVFAILANGIYKKRIDKLVNEMPEDPAERTKFIESKGGVSVVATVISIAIYIGLYLFI